jgi:hypothetical protein
MISQVEVTMYVEEAIPEIHNNLISSNQGDVYGVLSMLVAFTTQNIKEHNYKIVKRCFWVVDILYSKGNCLVKGAVENIFVYSFTNMLQVHPAEKKQVLSIIPITLFSLYITQVTHRGC